MNEVNLKNARELAEKIARRVGKFLLKKQNEVEILQFKDRQDILTNVDLQAEKKIIEAIEEKYPSHNIFSEEIGLVEKDSQYTWFIDPLDGTKEYSRGLPVFNVNISLEARKETLLGVVYIPKIDELYSCAKGMGAFENKKRIKVSQQDKLKNSFIYTHLPSYKVLKEKFEEMWEKLGTILNSCYRLRSFQPDIISLCWLAKGGLDGYVFLMEDEKWFDVGAGILMVQEADGKVTDTKGKPIKNRDLTKGFVASNGKVHNQLLKILNK